MKLVENLFCITIVIRKHKVEQKLVFKLSQLRLFVL